MVKTITYSLILDYIGHQGTLYRVNNDDSQCRKFTSYNNRVIFGCVMFCYWNTFREIDFLMV